MANVLSLKKLQNKPSRSGFDLSKRVLFTAKFGELLPIWCKEVIPGDSFDIDLKSFTRTRPVNSAAFTRFKEYVDFYFVPTNLLWNKFNTFVTQMLDNGQKATSINGNVTLTDEHPYFTLSQVVDLMSQLNSSTGGGNMFGFKRYNLSRKLLQYLGYGDVDIYINQSMEYIDNAKLNPFPLLAYQKIYADYYRNSQWETPYAPAFNVDYISGAAGTLNLPLSQIDIHNNQKSMFELRYANWNKDYFMGLQPSAQYGNSASVITDGTLQDIQVSDWSVTNGLISSGDFSSYGTDLKELHVRKVTTLPYGQAGYTSAMQVRYPNADNTATYTFTPYFMASDIQKLRTSLGLDGSSTGEALFSVLALRQAEALQKWKEITQSSQQDYKSQLEAHWDVNISDAYSDRCTWIKGIDNTINIDPVLNTNITSDNAANVAGNATGVNSGNISFRSDVHGYIMAIYHCVPILDFSLKSGIKRQNLKTTAADYAIPEFDKTGMVGVPIIELTNTQQTTDGIIGYAPRYYDYKTDYDEVLGGFQDSEFAEWTAPVSQEYINGYLNAGLIRHTAIDYRFMKVNPKLVDPIFGINADDTYATDQLMVNAFVGAKAVRKLDYDGLPY